MLLSNLGYFQTFLIKTKASFKRGLKGVISQPLRKLPWVCATDLCPGFLSSLEGRHSCRDAVSWSGCCSLGYHLRPHCPGSSQAHVHPRVGPQVVLEKARSTQVDLHHWY